MTTDRLIELPCNNSGLLGDVHVFNMNAGGPCGCGKYASQGELDAERLQVRVKKLEAELACRTTACVHPKWVDVEKRKIVKERLYFPEVEVGILYVQRCEQCGLLQSMKAEI